MNANLAADFCQAALEQLDHVLLDGGLARWPGLFFQAGGYLFGADAFVDPIQQRIAVVVAVFFGLPGLLHGLDEFFGGG